jgi:ABC-type transport system involved in multi-copper enzyme maturation permease subunit
MLKTIIYREFLANVMTFRFLLGLVICIGLVGTSAYVLTHSYEDRLQSYQLAVQAHTDEIRGVRTYSELSISHRPKVDKKPRLMSILNEGVEGRLGNTVEVSHSHVPTKAKQHGSDNPYLVVFRRIDLTLVFQIVISLLALLFAYDTIAGARENGTLPLTLSNPIPRGVLLLGKYLGGMLSLVPPLMMSLLAGLLVVLRSPYTSIASSDWARIGLFSLVSLIYVSVFFTLGMLFSSRSRRAATALMLAMFFWVIFALVWPNASAFAVSKLVPIKSDADLSEEGFFALLAQKGSWEAASSQHRIWGMWMSQYRREVEHFEKQRDVDKSFGGSMYRDPDGESFVGEFEGPPEKLPLWHEYIKFKEELRIDYADKAGKMWQGYLTENPIRQAKLARNIARISPAAAYASATEILAETDLESHLRFLQQAKQYRKNLIQYLRDQKAFESAAWYSKEAGEKIVKEGIPLFHETPEPLSSSAGRATFDILILVLLNVVFFLSTYLSFLRYSVR